MKKICLLFITLFVCANLFADENHYINVFVGDRAAGLGGAYTALADGPEGVFYNPAGIAFSGSQYFSLSANAIQFKMLYYKHVYDRPNGKPFDYFRYSISLIPNFFGFLQKEKHFTFAFTISCPDSEFYDQRANADIVDTFQGSQVTTPLNVNFDYKNQIYEAGPTFAFLPNKHFSIGFSGFFRYRDIKLINSTVRHFTEIKDGQDIEYFSTDTFYTNDRIFGLNFQLGLQIMPFDKMSIGYTISTPFDIVDIRTEQTTKKVDYFKGDNPPHSETGILDNTLTVYNIGQHRFFRPMYIKQALGFCFFINKSILLTLDGYLYIPIQNVDANGNLVSYYYNKQTGKYDAYLGADLYKAMNVIGNVAVGFECYVTPNFPLRFGFFTNFTNSKEIKAYTQNADDYIHMLGGSFSFGFSTSDMAINLGAVVQGGVGKAQMITDEYTTQELIGVSANLFISSTYQF